MFYIIGLGLSDEKDVSLRGLEVVQLCQNMALVHSHRQHNRLLGLLHACTLKPTQASSWFKKSAWHVISPNCPPWAYIVPEKEELYAKSLVLADRGMIETESDEILRDAHTQDVALLVVGDPFGATTHTDILLRARALGIPTRVIHNASIMNAVGACGLQLYNFGQTVSLVFFTDTWRPDSFYDRVRENVDLGMHTLVLLDIKVKEQSEENLIRCIFSPILRPVGRTFVCGRAVLSAAQGAKDLRTTAIHVHSAGSGTAR